MNNQELILWAMKLLASVEFMNYRFTCREAHGGVMLSALYLDQDISDSARVKP